MNKTINQIDPTMLGLLISKHTNTGQSSIAGQMGRWVWAGLIFVTSLRRFRQISCPLLDRLDFDVHHLNHIHDHQNDVDDDQNDVDDHHGLNEKCNKPVSAAERG